MSFLHKKGFTLIELLIVVAIIAILAAIAVPNFLEAQTRAKVSKAKADMRTLTTALESYYVDHNNYVAPENGQYTGGNEWSATSHRTAHFQTRTDLDGDLNNTGGFFYHLSTPVAYIANSFLSDPFVTGGGINSYLKYIAFNQLRPISYYGYTRVRADNIAPLWPNGYRGMPGDKGGDQGNGSGPNARNAATHPQIHWWALYSLGPDQQEGAFVENLNGTLGFINMYSLLRYKVDDYDASMYAKYLSHIYDPTNGTKSQGEIWHLGGGRPSYDFNHTSNLDGIKRSSTNSGAYRLYYPLSETAN